MQAIANVATRITIVSVLVLAPLALGVSSIALAITRAIALVSMKWFLFLTSVSVVYGACPRGQAEDDGCSGFFDLCDCELCPAGTYQNQDDYVGVCKNCPAGHGAGSTDFQHVWETVDNQSLGT